MTIGAGDSTGDEVEGVCEDEAEYEVADGHLDEGEEERNAWRELVLALDVIAAEV